MPSGVTHTLKGSRRCVEKEWKNVKGLLTKKSPQLALPRHQFTMGKLAQTKKPRGTPAKGGVYPSEYNTSMTLKTWREVNQKAHVQGGEYPREKKTLRGSLDWK